MRNVNAVRDNSSAGKKDIHQEQMGLKEYEGKNCRCSPKDVSSRTFKRTAKGTPALTISFKGPALDFCAFTNVMHSNNFSTGGNCGVFYNEC